MGNTSCEDEIEDEATKIYLKEEDSLDNIVNLLILDSLEDFLEVEASDAVARHAAEITRASITDGTRGGHIRYAEFRCQSKGIQAEELRTSQMKNNQGLHCIPLAS
ncbi:hypothetical protein Hypma_013731 [Hypsizygus marmoreus]|uniref:Uncharacterized protein n=1 Tax=Hypsizygus marmoreus TaxID=39966 RepID=A0A369JI87_HYPMA|nr:hypothetical protein Hypma_013731 [Hypsizygus marmoreus]